MAGETPTPPAEQYGITDTLSGYTIESKNITETPLVEQVPNQINQVEDEIQYDTRYDLRLTLRGATKPTATIISFGTENNTAIKWAVDSVEDAGTYNGLRRYNLAAHRTTKYPKAATTARTAAVAPAST